MSNASDFEIKDGVLVKYNGTDEVVVVPDSVVEIGERVFEKYYLGFGHNYQVKKIVLPNGLRKIGGYAFWMSGIERIIIPDTVVEIGEYAFEDCEKLKEITLPDGLKRVGDWAFYRCHSLRKITMPVGLEELGFRTFWFSGSIDNKVVERGYSLFYGLASISKTLSDGSRCRINIINKEINDNEKIVAVINLAQLYDQPVRAYYLDKNNWKQLGDLPYYRSVIIPLTEKAIPVYDQLVAVGKIEKISMNKSNRIHAALKRLEDKEFPVSEELKPVFAMLFESGIDEVVRCAEEDESPQYIQMIIDIGAVNTKNQSKMVKCLLNSPVQEIKDFADRLSQTKLPELPIDIDAPPRSIIRRLETIKADELLKSYGIVYFPEVILADGSGTARVEYLKYILAEYVYNYDKKELKIIEKADKTAERLDKKSLQSALLTIYHGIEDAYNQMAVLPALFRYADGETIRRIYPARATHHYWNDWHSRRDPASSALMLSDTVEAIQYLDKYGLLEDYSDFRFIDEDYLRDQIRSLPEVEDINQTTYDFGKHCFVYADNASEISPISVETIKKYLEEAKEEIKPFTDEGLPEVLLADKTGPAPKEYFAFILSEYSLNCDCESPRFIRKAEEVARFLDRGSLADAVDALYRDYVKAGKDCVLNHKTWAAIFRFASGPVVKDFYSLIKYEYDENESLLLSDTREAMIIAEKRDLLWKYAFIRGTNEVKLRDSIMADFGLDEEGIKTYDLGSGKITVRLNSELKLELFDEKAGKTVKSIPKRNADPDKYEKAKQDYDDLRKNVKNVAKSRVNILFKDFLEGSEYSLSEWKKLFLKNAVLNRVCRLIVWAQDEETFTLGENGPIDYSGKLYELSDTPIVVAHPMEMTNIEVAGWQHYFLSNGLKQPFQQVWEPVYDLNAIESNRYDGCKIPLYRFYKQEKHGIEFSGYFMYGDVHIYFRDCGAYVEYIEGGNDLNALYGIEGFKISRPSRKANHIVGYLDRITIISRIHSDDISIMEIINQFTLAQIMEFISEAQEAQAPNVLAALMEYKNNKYPDFDPMSEFTLDV